MTLPLDTVDAVIIGGGFYGSAIAIYLAEKRGFQNIIIVENEDALLKRASYCNQARVHNGYHYPRSYQTAYRSRVNFRRFIADWPDAVYDEFTKLYAIARNNSKTTARQFLRFFSGIGAKIDRAAPEHRALFNSHLIEDVFVVEECAFNAKKLASWAAHKLDLHGIDVRLRTKAVALRKGDGDFTEVVIRRHDGEGDILRSRRVFNCTYSGINQISGDFLGTKTEIKQEITEIIIVDVPEIIRDVGVTVMDGPFFSLMPFPPCGAHSLSHVRYTPHVSWPDVRGESPYARLAEYDRVTRFERMRRDAARYLPAAANVQYRRSLFEVKSVLMKSEDDDARPILLEKDPCVDGVYSILGGKIDNIYDALEFLDSEFH